MWDTPGKTDTNKTAFANARKNINGQFTVVCISCSSKAKPETSDSDLCKDLDPNTTLVCLTQIDSNEHVFPYSYKRDNLIPPKKEMEEIRQRFSELLGIDAKQICCTSMFVKEDPITKKKEQNPFKHEDAITCGAKDGPAVWEWIQDFLKKKGVLLDDMVPRSFENIFPSPIDYGSTSTTEWVEIMEKLKKAAIGDTVDVQISDPKTGNAVTSIKILKVFNEGISKPKLVQFSTGMLKYVA